MSINEWLIGHPLISLSSIERSLDLTKGTLRMNKTIPERYVKDIELLLFDYGYLSHNAKPSNTASNDAIYYHVKHVLKVKNEQGWKVSISPELPEDAAFMRV